jgi:putative serine protease PepD
MNSRSRMTIAVVVALAIGVGAGFAAHSLVSGPSASPSTNSFVIPAQPASTTGKSLAQLYQLDAPAVVDIRVTVTTTGNGFGPQQASAEGTGFEIDSKGNIMTAEHVVDGASSIKVQFQDGSMVPATLVGKDGSTDTAVIHVNVPAAQLHPLTLGSSARVQPGDAVIAIGSPFSLTETMTAGIVSAINRTITAPNNFSISGAIQTDAAVNHGNSGGPLIDVTTNSVIGINTQILNDGDTNDFAGVAFAVPIDASKAVAETLMSGKAVKHAWLGVRIGDALTGSPGAQIGEIIAGSPAAKAGLKKGDVITAFNGAPIIDADGLTSHVTQSQVGDKVTITYRRGSATHTVTVTLADQSSIPK